MRRVLAILFLLFAHSWPLRIMSAFALLSVALGVFVGSRDITNNFVLLITLLWSGGAFRQVVSDRRLSMLPRFRVHAVAALILVALAVGCAAGLAAVFDPAPQDAGSAVDTALIAFSLVSFFLLLNQWVATLRAGVLLQLLLIVLAVPYMGGDVYESALVERAWAPTLAALLGWSWLLLAFRKSAELKAPNPWLRIESTAGLNAGQRSTAAMFGLGPLNLGRPANPAGTLMRGGNDGWINRVGAALIWVLGPALLWMLWTYAAVPAGWREPHADSIALILLASFIAIAAISPTRLVDWPTRLRYVWLRAPGNRDALWRMLERNIGEEVGVVTAITSAASIAISLATGTSVPFLVAYVAGASVAVLVGAYCVMAMRIGGASVTEISLCCAFGWSPVIFMIVVIGPQPAVLGSVIVVLGGVALISRHFVRKQFIRIDWCAVKPTRNLLPRARGSES
jgi:hypothetical protein